MSVIPDYKDYKIFVDSEGKFSATMTGSDDEVARASSLAELKRELDVITSANLKQPCLIAQTNYDDFDFPEGKITSLKNRAGYSTRYRVTFKAGQTTRREELRADQIFKVTAKNKALIAEMTANHDKIKALEKTNEKLEERLEHFTNKELLGEKKQ